MDMPGAPVTTAAAGSSSPGRLHDALERRAAWIEALVVLTVIAAAFVVLGFLARYFQDYFRLILIFFFGWLLAFLISPVADWLQRRLTRLPRGIAVIAVIVPVIVILALVIVRIVAALADSFGQLGERPARSRGTSTVVPDRCPGLAGRTWRVGQCGRRVPVDRVRVCCQA